jgi:hypothetical protein
LISHLKSYFIAEGSDWCWWYGDDHFSIQKDRFDELFRMHLRAIYVYLDKRVPDSLGESIMARASRESAKPKPQRESLYPVITGERVNQTWAEIDEIDIRVRQGAMHKAEPLALDEIRAEIVDATLYLKLVPRGGGPNDLSMLIELKDKPVQYHCRPQGLELRSLNGSLQVGTLAYAWKTAMELAVAIEGLSEGRQPFAVTLRSDTLDSTLRIPADGWLLH